MKRLISLFIFFASSSLFAVPECEYEINLSNATVQVSEQSQVVQQGLSISRRIGQVQRCSVYRIFFSKGQANSYNRMAYLNSTNTLNYNLHQNINLNGILKEFNDALSSVEYISGNMPEDNTPYSNNFFISVPALSTQSNAPSGIYTDVIQLAVYGFNPSSGNYSFERVTNVTVSLIVHNKIQISIVEEGGTFNASSTSKILDFGELEMNEEKGVDVMVSSNTPYQLQLSSQNSGNLKSPGQSTVAYNLKSNGSSVGLSGSQGSPVLIGGGNPTNAPGDRYNLKIKITESVENKPSGLYQDVITITAIAN